MVGNRERQEFHEKVYGEPVGLTCCGGRVDPLGYLRLANFANLRIESEPTGVSQSKTPQPS